MSFTPTNLLVHALATKRLTRLITEDQITATPRNAILDRFPKSPVSYLLTCNWCSSVWAATAVLAVPVPIRNILALSEAAMLIYKLDDLV